MLSFALNRASNNSLMKELLIPKIFALLILAVSFLLCGISSATAAYDWGGAYIGVDAGYGFGTTSIPAEPLPSAQYFDITPTTMHPSLSGGLVGANVGYDWQSGKTVFGAITDFYISGIDGKTRQQQVLHYNGTPYSGNNFFGANSKGQWLSSLRARIGITPLDNLLIFTTGGLAISEYHYNSSLNFCPSCTVSYKSDFSGTQIGPVLGAGASYAIADNWSINAQYLHYAFGNTSQTVYPVPSLLPYPYQVKYVYKLSLDTILFGLNYKFN